jgi:hypothetical protein
MLLTTFMSSVSRFTTQHDRWSIVDDLRRQNVVTKSWMEGNCIENLCEASPLWSTVFGLVSTSKLIERRKQCQCNESMRIPPHSRRSSYQYKPENNGINSTMLVWTQYYQFINTLLPVIQHPSVTAKNDSRASSRSPLRKQCDHRSVEPLTTLNAGVPYWWPGIADHKRRRTADRHNNLSKANVGLV